MLSFSKLLEFQQELVAKNTPHAVVTIYKVCLFFHRSFLKYYLPRPTPFLK